MQLSCQQSKLSSDVRCPICGQGFLIYAEPTTHANQKDNRRIIQQTLRDHHTVIAPSSSAHPGSAFNIPSWSGAPPFFASAFLSDLLDNAL